MTTSPGAKNTNGSVESESLLIERASSVGWLFIQSYYDMYNKNYENFHMLYHAEGSLSHSTFPEDGKTDTSIATVLRATGTDGIKARFLKDESLQLKNNSIVVTGADFQVSLKKNILIVVSGEWSRNGSPYWQFDQTFLLAPGKKANSYDVANDVLKFVDFKEFSDDKETVDSIAKNNAATAKDDVVESDPPQEKVSEDQVEPQVAVAAVAAAADPEPVATTEAVAKSDSTEEKKADPVPAGAEKNETSEPKEEEAVTGADAQQKEDATSGVKSREETNDSGESSENTNTTTSTKKNDASRQPMSWAALASQAAEKEGTVPSVVKAAKTATAGTSSTSTAGAPSTVTSKKTASPETSDKKGNGKDDWFPIYIRGIKNLDDDLVKNYLVEHFGAVLLFKPLMNIALCDFATEEGQRRALDAGRATIDGITFDLEKRESKRDNGNSNGNGPSSFAGKKGKDLKEKQSQDSKRKNDKKQGSKKRPGAKHPEPF